MNTMGSKRAVHHRIEDVPPPGTPDALEIQHALPLVLAMVVMSPVLQWDVGFGNDALGKLISIIFFVSGSMGLLWPIFRNRLPIIAAQPPVLVAIGSSGMSVGASWVLFLNNTVPSSPETCGLTAGSAGS